MAEDLCITGSQDRLSWGIYFRVWGPSPYITAETDVPDW
jgi:hypothetical protein